MMTYTLTMGTIEEDVYIEDGEGNDDKYVVYSLCIEDWYRCMKKMPQR